MLYESPLDTLYEAFLYLHEERFNEALIREEFYSVIYAAHGIKYRPQTLKKAIVKPKSNSELEDKFASLGFTVKVNE